MMNLYNHNDFSHTEMGQQTLHGRFILESQASIKRSVHENLYTREKIIRIHAMGTCIANDVRHVTYSSACLFSTKNGSGWKGSMLLLFVIEMFHPCAERPYSISKSCFSKQNERYSQWPLWFKKIIQFSMKYFLNHGEMTNQRSHLLSIHCKVLELIHMQGTVFGKAGWITDTVRDTESEPFSMYMKVQLCTI